MELQVLFLAIGLIILMLTGAHIAVAMGMISVIYLLVFTNLNLGVLPDVIVTKLSSITLMACPLFILSGLIMEKVDIVNHLFGFVESLTKRVPGGTGVATMFCCMLLAAMSGSSAAVAGMMGIVALPEMRKRNYPDEFSSGIIAIGGTLGILIPPSLTMIIYGVLTDVSVPKLFIAGLIPGLLLGLLLCLNILLVARKKGLKASPMNWKEVRRSSSKAWGGLLLPVVILGGIYGGIFTSTEAAVVAAVYAIIYGLIVKTKDCGKIFPEVGRRGLEMTAMLFFIMSGAFIFTTVLTAEKIPDMLTQAIINLGLPLWAFLIGINAFYLIMGMFLDPVSTMLLTVPIVFPATQALGIDPLHFAVFFTINMEIATVTPPVGMNLFVLSGISKVPVATVFRGVLPFSATMLGTLALITWVPILSTWLPGLMMGD